MNKIGKFGVFAVLIMLVGASIAVNWHNDESDWDTGLDRAEESLETQAESGEDLSTIDDDEIIAGIDSPNTGKSDSGASVSNIPAPPPKSLQESYGLCPGAPPSDGGMKRRPDSVMDGNGILHKVWQERFDGQFEICYARKPGEMGLGSENNPAFRITNTPTDSVDPRIAIDEASGIAYIIWTEILPPDLNIGGKEKEGGWTPEALLQYTATATFEPGDPLWSTPKVLGESICQLKKFAVMDGSWEIELGKGKPGWASSLPDLIPKPCSLPDEMPKLGGKCSLPDLKCEGLMDTDEDGISDSDEVLGILGYFTHWWNPDTDLDWLPDHWEILKNWDPTMVIWSQFAYCFPSPSTHKDPFCKGIWTDGLCMFIDADNDGIIACNEDNDYPVTTEVVELTDDGDTVYRFWPMVDGDYNVVLRTQQRTFQSGQYGCDFINVSIEVTLDGLLVNTWTTTWSDVFPWVWSIDTVASFSLTGLDMTAVTILQSIDIGLTVLFDPPHCGSAYVAVVRALAVDWIKLELDSDRSEVNYKDADDFVNTPLPFTTYVHTEEMVIQLDPYQRELLLELDSMDGHDWVPEVLNELINAFSDANIILHYKIDETNLPTTEVTGVFGAGDVSSLSFGHPPTSDDETSVYLSDHRNTTLRLLGYVHVMNVHNLPGACGIADQGEASTHPKFSGVLIPDQNFIDGVCYGVANFPFDLFSTRLAVLLHEIGHALNLAHDKSTGTVDPLCVIDDCGDPADPSDDDDICNYYNNMGYSYCFASTRTDESFYGTGNNDRRVGSTAAIGRPRFSYESVDQIDLVSLLSVDVANNYPALGLYV
jgi:hypothetical protein